MAKYYVQSGSLQMIVLADNRRGAAIWAVHRALCRTMPFLGESPPADAPCDGAPQRLGPWIHVSETGFRGRDAQRYATFDVLTQWNQLMVALAKIEDELCCVGQSLRD